MKSFRYTLSLITAINIMGFSACEKLDNETLNDLSYQIQVLLNKVELGSIHKTKNEDTLPQQELSDGFIASIRKVAKPGLKTDS